MKIKAVLFDLDGTLLPMDQDVFTADYLNRLGAYLAPHGYEPRKLIGSIWQGTEAMMRGDGSRINEEVFWDFFESVWGEGSRRDEPIFEEFYREEFCHVRASCGHDARAAEIVRGLRARGIRTLLATSPIFPMIATAQRIEWAGLTPDDFEYVTSYENSRRTKPSLDYYRDLLATVGLVPEECVMVGNDVGEDMVARELGMQVFLLTDCLINRVGGDVADYPSGSFDELREYLDEILREDRK